MSDTIMVALISGGFNVVAIIISRLLSRHEHKKTAGEVAEIKRMVNGNSHD